MQLQAETQDQLKGRLLTAAFTGSISTSEVDTVCVYVRAHVCAHVQQQQLSSLTPSQRQTQSDMTLLSHPTSSSHIPATLQY